MADSILSITIRDTEHPCAPYQTTRHTFLVQIFNCDGKPLFWKGVNYGKPFPLDVPGEKGGRIHAQVKVPPWHPSSITLMKHDTNTFSPLKIQSNSYTPVKSV